MTTKRFHTLDIVKCVALGAVLLPLLYVGSWLAASWAVGRGHLSTDTAVFVAPAFRPIKSYCRAELPGADQLRELWWSVSSPDMSGLPAGVMVCWDPDTWALAPDPR